MWRKTMSKRPGSRCFGVDPNRNFDANFGGGKLLLIFWFYNIHESFWDIDYLEQVSYKRCGETSHNILLMRVRRLISFPRQHPTRSRFQLHFDWIDHTIHMSYPRLPKLTHYFKLHYRNILSGNKGNNSRIFSVTKYPQQVLRIPVHYHQNGGRTFGMAPGSLNSLSGAHISKGAHLVPFYPSTDTSGTSCST